MSAEAREIVRSMTPVVKFDWLEQLNPVTGRMVNFYGIEIPDNELVEMLESPFNRSQK